MTAQITNGTISHGKTLKLGEYENKRGDVSLSFNIAEGADPDHAIHHVKTMVHKHLAMVLDTPAPKETAAPAPAAEPEAKKSAKKAAKLPKEEVKSAGDAADVEEYDRAPLPKPKNGVIEVDDPLGIEEPVKAPKFIEKEVAAANAKAAAEVEDDDLDDLLGTSEPEAKEITDKELQDAVNKKQAEVKNGPAIRKALGEFGIKSPPGRVIDLQQKDRPKFLELLGQIKALA